MEMTDGTHPALRFVRQYDSTAKINSTSQQMPIQKTTRSELEKLRGRVYFVPFRDPSLKNNNCGSI